MGMVSETAAAPRGLKVGAENSFEEHAARCSSRERDEIRWRAVGLR